MIPDIRRVVFKCVCQQRTKPFNSVLLHQRQLCKQSFFEKNQSVVKWFKDINKKLQTISDLFLRQCNVVAAQRLRRSFLIMAVYRRLYGVNTLKSFCSELGSSLLKHCKSKSLVLLCSVPLFKWEQERISDNELKSLVDDMKEVEHIEKDFKQPTDDKGYMKSWEQVIDKDHFKVWRKPLPDTSLYQYKVYGTFYDVTPKCFLAVQVDLDYRKQWDPRVIKLDVVDRDDQTNTEVVQWITHFPYPMYSREYVYTRRYKVDYDNNVMVLSSHAVDHPKCPVEKDHVRVHLYSSSMVIRPHKQFEDDGFDYVMTYYDDPQASYTSFCYSWLAKTGVPRFVDELHEAAKNMEKNNIHTGFVSKQNFGQDSGASDRRQYC